jgi:hypothetical protein
MTAYAGHTTKHLNIAVPRSDVPLHLISSEALQVIKGLLGCDTIALLEPNYLLGGIEDTGPPSGVTK